MFFRYKIESLKHWIRISIFACVCACIGLYLFSESKNRTDFFREQITSLNIVFEKLIERRLETVKFGWFAWDDMANAIEKKDKESLQEYMEEIQDFFHVAGVKITENENTNFIFGDIFEEIPNGMLARNEKGLFLIETIPVQGSNWELTPYKARVVFNIDDLEEMFLSLTSYLPFLYFDSREAMKKDQEYLPVLSNRYFIPVPSPIAILFNDINSVYLPVVLIFLLGGFGILLTEFLYNKTIVEKKLAILSNTLETRDGYSIGHSSRVASYADMIASEMGISKSRRKKLRVAALCHDFGKLIIPIEILDKPGTLTKEEQIIVEQHPVMGRDILRSVLIDEHIERIVLEHHERWDGQGYPNGLKGKDIVLEARILAIADAFDAMTSASSFREAMSEENARSVIKACSGTQFDPEIASLVWSLKLL